MDDAIGDQGVFNFILSFFDDIICLFFLFVLFVIASTFAAEPVFSGTVRTIIMVIAIIIFAVDIIAFVVDLIGAISEEEFGASEIADIVLSVVGLLACVAVCLAVRYSLSGSIAGLKIQDYILIFLASNYFLAAFTSGILNFSVEEVYEYVDEFMEGLKTVVIAFLTIVASLVTFGVVAIDSTIVYVTAIVTCVYLVNEVSIIVVNLVAPIAGGEFEVSDIVTNVLNAVEVVFFILAAIFMGGITQSINADLCFSVMGWKYLVFVGLAYSIFDIALSVPVNIVANFVNEDDG